MSDSSRRAPVAQRSSPSLRLRQTTLHFRTDHSPSVGLLEAPRTHEIGQRRTQPVVTETSDPRDVRLPTQSPEKDQESGRALSDVTARADVDGGLTVRVASNSTVRAGQDPATGVSSEVLVEGEPVTDGQLSEMDEASLDEKATAMAGSAGKAEIDPPGGLTPAMPTTICLKVQAARVASDVPEACNSDEVTHRLMDESADVSCHDDDIKQRGPVELANECRIEAELFSLLEQRLPSSGLVAERYGLNITLEKLKCLQETTWLGSEVITFWLAKAKLQGPYGLKDSEHMLQCSPSFRPWCTRRCPPKARTMGPLT